MTPTTVQLFYGLLAIAAIVMIVAIVGLRLLALGSATARGWYASAATTVEPLAYGLAWFVALAATMGSLYFSEVAGYVPCTLCWYQRIAMYPLVVILAIAAAWRDPSGRRYAGALAAIGAVIAAYHVALEWIPALDTGACQATAPCTYVWFRAFGVFSLPTLALIAFLLILTLLAVRAPRASDDVDDTPDLDPDRRTA
jgi:disulfide bond formation protein DsbB